MGHRAGRKAVREAVEGCVALGVRVLTLYTFSLENWERSAREVSGLWRILEQVLREEVETLERNNVRLRTIGRVDLLPDHSRKLLDATIRRLDRCDGMTLVLALSYGGAPRSSTPCGASSPRTASTACRRAGSTRPTSRGGSTPTGSPTGPADPHERGAEGLELPPVAAGVRRVLGHGHAVARLPPQAPLPGRA